MRARVLGAVLSTAAVSVALAVAMPTQLSAQRRPGVGMGFYTTTGLITGEVEGGSVTSSTALASSPSFEASFLLTAPLKKMPKRAWIAGVRARALALGDNDYCSVRPEPGGCQIRRFDERAAFLAGGAFDIRSTVLRAPPICWAWSAARRRCSGISSAAPSWGSARRSRAARCPCALARLRRRTGARRQN
jgi:hypothetical protein